MSILPLVLTLGLSCSAQAATAQPPQPTDGVQSGGQQTAQPTDHQPDQPTDPPTDGQTDQKAPPPTPEHTGFHALAGNLMEDVKLLPSKQNLYLALIGGGAGR